MSECNGHIQGEPGHEEIFFCPKCHYIELQAQLAAAEKERDLWRKLHKDELVQNKRYKDALKLISIMHELYGKKMKKIAKQVLKGD